MGIPGLLPALASVTRPAHIQEYKGQTVAVDAYVWLHRGAYACSSDLCLGIPTDKYIAYCMKMVKMLQYFGVKPILVFDGGNLPIKRDQESTRRSRRKGNREKAMELLREGNKTAANEFFQKAVDVTPRMAYNLIQVLKQDNIDYIVAPYEADAQMAFLSINGIVDAVITEDSDLVPYGATKILFKLDQTGQGKEIRRENLEAARDMDLRGWTQSMIRHMCIMAGCDYLEGLNGFGVKKAHTWIRKYKDDMDRIFTLLRADRSIALPEDYETRFKQADLTFQHQRVYDPRTKTIRPLTDFPSEFRNHEQLDFIGPHLEPDIGSGIAMAVLDPHNKEPFEKIIAAANQRLPDGSSAATTATTTTAIDATKSTPSNKPFMDKDAALFQRRRVAFSLQFGSPSSSAKKGASPPPVQMNKLSTYFNKSFKPPSKATGSATQAGLSASQTSSQVSQPDVLDGRDDIMDDDDEDIDLSNVTRDSDDEGGNDFDESFENMKAMVGIEPRSEKKLASSTADLSEKGETPSLRRAKTEPVASSSSSSQRGPKVVLETPPRDVKVVSRFFSGSNVTDTAKENGKVVKIVSDDIFDCLLEEEPEPVPVARQLNSEFDAASLVKNDEAVSEPGLVSSSQEGSAPAALVPGVGSTIAEMSQHSSMSSASTDVEPPKPSSAEEVKPSPAKLERPKTLDLKSMFAYNSQSKAKTTPAIATPSQQRRLSLPPIDPSKVVDLLEDDEDEEERSGFNTSYDSAGLDTQILPEDGANSSNPRRPSLDSVLTGGLENKENSRTAASSVLSRFAFGSVNSKAGSGTAPSTPATQKKRKSPSPKQTGLSIQEKISSFASKRQKTSEGSAASTPSRAPLRAGDALVIPDSDEEF